MSRYDYGLRGLQDTPPPRQTRPGYSRYGRDYLPYGGSPTEGEPVDARYNADYTFPGGQRNPTNPFPYGQDGYTHFDGEGGYRLPYWTTGGTRTFRGTSSSSPYDYWDYERFRRIRYPDGI